MKTFKEIVNEKLCHQQVDEKLVVNKNFKSQGFHTSTGDQLLKDAEYAIVYPYGDIEFYDETYIKDGIEELNKEINKEINSENDSYDEIEEQLTMYEELLDLEPNVWSSISGPYNSNGKDLKGTIAIKYKKK